MSFQMNRTIMWWNIWNCVYYYVMQTNCCKRNDIIFEHKWNGGIDTIEKKANCKELSPQVTRYYL